MTQPKYQILIVEDNATDRELITRILMQMDPHYLVTSVGTAQLAYTAIAQKKPDLLILDIYLPHQNGFSFLQKLRDNGYEDLPVLLVSTFLGTDDRLKGFQMGVMDFINKPIVTEELKARVTLQVRLKKTIDDQLWALQKTNEGIKLLYKELEVKNQELKQLNQMKDEFVSNVSHELRTPLTIIRESINQITDGLFGDVNEKQSQYLNKSLINVDRLSNIINDLLDIATLERGKLKLQKERVNIIDLADDVVVNFALPAQKKGLTIKHITSQNPIDIFADKEKLLQVMTNLVGNACKFTERGDVVVEIIDSGNQVEMHVKDSGIGIANEDIPRLFSKFEQIGRQSGAGPKGTGLGLSIAKGIIEAHDGQIIVKSQPGQGSEFIVNLPKGLENNSKEKTE